MKINMSIKSYLVLSSFVSLLLVIPSGFVFAQVFEKDLYFDLQNNTDVTKLQEFLIDQGVYSGPVTGNFFSLTLRAVKNFQLKEGVTPAAGYFGPKTRVRANAILSAAIGESRKQAVIETGTTTPPIVSSTARVDAITLLLEQIKALQQQIATLQQKVSTATTTPSGTIPAIPATPVIPSPSTGTLATPAIIQTPVATLTPSPVQQPLQSASAPQIANTLAPSSTYKEPVNYFINMIYTQETIVATGTKVFIGKFKFENNILDLDLILTGFQLRFNDSRIIKAYTTEGSDEVVINSDESINKRGFRIGGLRELSYNTPAYSKPFFSFERGFKLNPYLTTCLSNCTIDRVSKTPFNFCPTCSYELRLYADIPEGVTDYSFGMVRGNLSFGFGPSGRKEFTLSVFPSFLTVPNF